MEDMFDYNYYERIMLVSRYKVDFRYLCYILTASKYRLLMYCSLIFIKNQNFDMSFKILSLKLSYCSCVMHPLRSSETYLTDPCTHYGNLYAFQETVALVEAEIPPFVSPPFPLK